MRGVTGFERETIRMNCNFDWRLAAVGFDFVGARLCAMRVEWQVTAALGARRLVF